MASVIGHGILICTAVLAVCFPSQSRITAGAAPVSRGGIAQNDTGTAEQRIQKAREAIAAGRYDDAKKELKLALTLDKESAAANLCLAFVYKQENKSKDAIKCVEAAIKSQPNYPDAHYLFAQLLFEKNDLAKSRREIDLAISQGANIRNAHALSGDIYLTQHANKLALECYEKALLLPGPDDKDTAMLRDRAGALANSVEFGSNRADPSYVRPRQLNSPRPVYPEQALGRGVQGTVKSGVLVDEQGRVSQVFLFSGLGYGLDAAAVKAARAVRFSPATKGGKPVTFWFTIIIEFNIK
jgi:TonB family protein